MLIPTLLRVLKILSAMLPVMGTAWHGTIHAKELPLNLSEIPKVLGSPPSGKASRSTVLKVFSSPQLTPSDRYQVFTVQTPKELMHAIALANKQGGGTAIYLEKGEYRLTKTLNITANHVWLLSKSGNPYDVILRGFGMKPTRGVNNLIRVSGSHFVLDGVTLTDSPNHLLQIAGESGASFPTIRNSILQDAYEQFIKVSYDLKRGPEQHSWGGKVEHSIFQYTRGVAPNYYTGGIDALGAKQWIVRDNVFRDIASPSNRIAQHAVHFWVNSENNQVVNNLFIDNDRAIGFGMPLGKHKSSGFRYSNKAGIIKGNLIYHSNNGTPFADTGIVLEASPETLLEDNLVFLEHSYPRAIEFRFPETTEVIIRNNQSNKMISSRNSGQASLSRNSHTLKADDFAGSLKATLDRLRVTNLYHLNVELMTIRNSEVYE